MLSKKVPQKEVGPEGPAKNKGSGPKTSKNKSLQKLELNTAFVQLVMDLNGENTALQDLRSGAVPVPSGVGRSHERMQTEARADSQPHTTPRTASRCSARALSTN